MIPIDVDQQMLSNVAEGDGEESRGKDVAVRPDENDPLAVACRGTGRAHRRRTRSQQIKQSASEERVGGVHSVHRKCVRALSALTRDSPKERGLDRANGETI